VTSYYQAVRQAIYDGNHDALKALRRAERVCARVRGTQKQYECTLARQRIISTLEGTLSDIVDVDARGLSGAHRR
jgi:hypothetical protein